VPCGNTVALVGGQRGKFCADEGNRIRCNRNGIGQWEKFRVKCFKNCNGEESQLEDSSTALIQEGEQPASPASKIEEEKKPDSFAFDASVSPLPWHRYGASFKWMWPQCPGGDCKKAAAHKVVKQNSECTAEFYYGIQSCGKFPTRSVTWKNPVTNKVEQSDVGCNCRGQLAKSVFYGTVTNTKDLSQDTQKRCGEQFSKWSAEIREKLSKWDNALETLSQEVARKCSPTYPVIVKEQKYKEQVRKLNQKQEDTQSALRATPPLIQDSFKWMKSPVVTEMPSNYEDNNGECKAHYTRGLSVCNKGNKDNIDSVSFGCGCNGMYVQSAQFGVITHMKDQSLKTQAKCARLFSKWSAEQAKDGEEDTKRAHELAPSIALRCNPTRKLAMKAKHQDAHLKTLSEVTPKMKAAGKKLAQLREDHEQLHKKELKDKARERSDKAIEKRIKIQGKEAATKHAERKDKEVAAKSYHGSWADKNDREERVNKAQVVADHNEKMLVKDLKARANGMEKQIKADAKPADIDSGVKNHRLAKKARKANMAVSELEEKVRAAKAKKAQQKMKFDNTQPEGALLASRLVQSLEKV